MNKSLVAVVLFSSVVVSLTGGCSCSCVKKEERPKPQPKPTEELVKTSQELRQFFEGLPESEKEKFLFEMCDLLFRRYLATKVRVKITESIERLPDYEKQKFFADMFNLALSKYPQLVMRVRDALDKLPPEEKERFLQGMVYTAVREYPGFAIQIEQYASAELNEEMKRLKQEANVKQLLVLKETIEKLQKEKETLLEEIVQLKGKKGSNIRRFIPVFLLSRGVPTYFKITNKETGETLTYEVNNSQIVNFVPGVYRVEAREFGDSHFFGSKEFVVRENFFSSVDYLILIFLKEKIRKRDVQELIEEKNVRGILMIDVTEEKN